MCIRDRYKAWQKNFERHVNRGERGIRILAPSPYKIKEEQEKIDPVTNEPVLDRDGMPVVAVSYTHLGRSGQGQESATEHRQYAQDNQRREKAGVRPKTDK